jgi:hypothetical protein
LVIAFDLGRLVKRQAGLYGSGLCNRYKDQTTVVDSDQGHIKLSITDRKEAIKELAEEGLSHRQIAKILGVTHPTVIKDLRGKNLPSVDEDDDEEWQESPPLLSVVDLNTGEIIPPPKRESEPQPTNADRVQK